MPPAVSPLRIALLCLALANASSRATAARNEVSLNTDWRFHFGDVSNAESPTTDDTAWSRIDVPHTWNALDGQDGAKGQSAMSAGMRGDYARGNGWYRRVLPTSPDWAGRRIYLQFDGVNRRADVFLNGRLIGTHLGGFARFRFDLTDAL